jgi:hypothetical protein
MTVTDTTMTVTDNDNDHDTTTVKGSEDVSGNARINTRITTALIHGDAGPTTTLVAIDGRRSGNHGDTIMVVVGAERDPGALLGKDTGCLTRLRSSSLGH